MDRTLTVTLSMDYDNCEATVEILEGETGDHVTKTIPYSPDEHPEFDEWIGAQIYGWLEMMDEEEEESKWHTKS